MKKSIKYESYATNVRIMGMAVVLCKLPYEKEHGDPKIVAKIIGDALEYYLVTNPKKQPEKKSESDKKNVDSKKI